MKKILLLSALVVLMITAKAQQDPQLNHWMFDKISFNPAAAGMDRMHSISGFFRSQWTNYAGNPNTFLANYNGYYNFGKQEIGLGATFFSDELGQETNTVGRLHGAYLKSVGGGTFSAGLSIGFLTKKLGNDWICSDPNDPNCGLDVAVPKTGTLAQSKPDLTLGLMYYKQNNYYVGLSMTHLTAGDLSKINMTVARHLYVMGGKNFDLNTAQPLTLRTNMLVKSDLKATPSADINANVLWNQMVWAGASYRTGDAVSPMIGFQKDFTPIVKGRTTTNLRLMIGYSYDVTTSDIRLYSDGSHDLFFTLSWRMTETPVRVKYGNPRFL